MSSIPRSRRTVASTEYVANAANLYHHTLDCAERLPKRWTFLITERLVQTATDVLAHAKSANSIYVSCTTDASLRRYHLQEAYASAQVLSSLLDEVCRRFPLRDDGSKACISTQAYITWAELLDREFDLLKGVMRSDRRKCSSHPPDGPEEGDGGDFSGLPLQFSLLDT